MTDITPLFSVSSPDIGELEQLFVSKAVNSGWVSSIGQYVDRFEREFAGYCNTKHGVSLANGTDALFIALKALGIGKGDEVILPSLTFVAVAAVVMHLGAIPVIVDVHPDYWCLDPIAVERAISERTKAIIAVHSYGHPADMDPILDLARPRNIRVIEDCAEAHGATYKGKMVGSMGDVGCFSFYGNKIITTGEGGMAVTNDTDLSARMKFLKDHAMDPNRRYFHPEAGFNCRLTNIQAALGCAQLERIGELQAKRAAILGWYQEDLMDVPGISLNPTMPWAGSVNWMVCAVINNFSDARRDKILTSLKEKGIDTRPFFLPIQVMPPYVGCRVVGREGGGTAISEKLSRAGFNLPSSSLLNRENVKYICSHLASIICS